ncbi:MAG: ABC transporter ATP-binding protein, partial [Deinococcota bacterium]
MKDTSCYIVTALALCNLFERYSKQVLDAVNLTKTYPHPSGDVLALNTFSGSFQAGEISAIVGPSGSGKSTLLNLLAGFDVPSQGSVHLDGQLISNLPDRDRADLRLTSFGFVFQSYNLISVLSAAQNVAFPMGLAGVPRQERRQRSRELLSRFGLAKRTNHLPFKLSGGERQRVSVARALANNPSVLFADEPTGNLDSKSGTLVLDALRDVAREGRCVIVVTHDYRMLDKVDRVIQLEDGLLMSDERNSPTQPSGQSVMPRETLSNAAS